MPAASPRDDYCKAATYDSTMCPMQDPNTLPSATGKTEKTLRRHLCTGLQLVKVGNDFVVTPSPTSGGHAV